MGKLTILLIIAASAGFLLADQQWTPPINVTVFYESLCPDSQDFIVNQLYPTWFLLRPFLHLRTRLVPYGKATDHYDDRTKEWYTVCQHGPQECKGNKMAACAIDILRNNTGIMHFVRCLSSSNVPDDVVQKCSSEAGMKFFTLKQCYTSYKGEQLLLVYGNITRSVHPKIQSVPAITINNYFNVTEQEFLTKNFTAALCKHIPGRKPPPCFAPHI